MIPETSTLLAYLAGVIVITLTPGPDMTFFLGRTLAQGVGGGLAALAGACAGLAVHSLLVAFGLSALIVASPTAFLAVKLAGAFYLLWLAVEAIRHGSTMRLDRLPVPRPLGRVFRQGLAINLLNPKIILFFMTFLPQFVSASDPHATARLLFLGLFFVVVSLPLTVPMILAADRLTGWLTRHPAATRAIDWLFAGIFGAFAVRIVMTQAR